ncbi:uncharacterized protein LOC110899126 [Helianthus annuus]|uniref:uncharacterized protein LOC110899126 n=1 Tax=Helianthus annuus TaxID=4232 RepID=UPI000B8F35F2|nr:uncharacterized protein LOC110899126 [Helianthus annuus]
MENARKVNVGKGLEITSSSDGCPIASMMKGIEKVVMRWQNSIGWAYGLKRYKNVIESFKEWLPTRYRPYITDIENVQPDGNCGFRSIARGLGMEQNDQWLFVRQQLLDEMIINEPLWRPMFCNIDNELYNDIYDSIYHLEVEPAPYRKWMQLPYAGLLAAQKFGVIIQHFSNGGNQTYFPMFDGPTTCRDHTTISIAFVKNNHFILLKLTNDCPMPPPNGLWSLYRTPEAIEWETLYASRIQQGKTLMASNKSQHKEYINVFG